MQQTQQLMDALIEKDAWNTEDYQALCEQLTRERNVPEVLGRLLGRLEQETDEVKGAAALKIGIVQYLMCRFGQALESLSAATDNKDRHWFMAQSYKALRQFDHALEEYDRAKSRGWDDEIIDLEVAEALALNGQIDEAGKAIEAVAKSQGESPGVLFVRGLICELTGETDKAGEAYEAACDADGAPPAALFRLAYFYDLHGEEASAMELYRECTSQPPVYGAALLNLAVLHEDAGQYDDAILCLKRVLALNPTHQRARLFLKDAEASKTMYFDEDQAKAIARRNAVLDIPVTDFELSVRARNCLKKMNIRTLGDLVQISEAELLSYKNFGETSLKEIKDMLAAKGLRLGQALEEGEELSLFKPEPPEPAENEGAGATPLGQIEFSVRARRALDTLGLKNIGELASKSEAELLGCKNFGQTSLNEVKQRLAEYGLALRASH
jgi:DNA-directed RNA polymerase subunit alpha